MQVQMGWVLGNYSQRLCVKCQLRYTVQGMVALARVNTSVTISNRMDGDTTQRKGLLLGIM